MKEYAVEWGWDQWTLGGYGPVASSPEEALRLWVPRALHYGDCIVEREVGTETWKYHSL